MDLAVQAVKEHGISIREAARIYNVSRSALQRRVGPQKRKIRAYRSVGIPSSLPSTSEVDLANTIKLMTRRGFAISRNEISSLVQSYVESYRDDLESEIGSYVNEYCRFKNNRPGEDWITCFMKKFQLSTTNPKKPASDPVTINEFYDTLNEDYINLNIENKPDHIWSLHEMCFCIDFHLDDVDANLASATVTVLTAAAANGFRFPPLIIFKGRQDYTVTQEIPEKLIPGSKIVLVSDEEGTSTAIFSDWFTNICNEITVRPLILFYSNRASRLGYRVIKKAIQENIIIIKLPSDTLEPLNATCFQPLQMQWEQKLSEHSEKNDRRTLTKNEFIDYFSEVFEKALTGPNIQRGFEFTGIYPLNREKYFSLSQDPPEEVSLVCYRIYFVLSLH